MEESAHSTEQRQLMVEIEAVSANIAKPKDPAAAGYEIEQGRKLIEKAISLRLPEDAYAKLRGQLEAQDKTAGA